MKAMESEVVDTPVVVAEVVVVMVVVADMVEAVGTSVTRMITLLVNAPMMVRDYGFKS